MTIAIIFVGFPCCGKTTIALELQKQLYNTVCIEQDTYYNGRFADHNAYLNAIEKECNIKKRKSKDNEKILLLCKNHHTQKNRKCVINIMKKYNIKYFIVNLIPKENHNNIIDELLNRIEKRSIEGTNSHLKNKSRKQSYYILKKGFIDTYEEPYPSKEEYLQLNFMDSIKENVDKILSFIKN